MSSVSVHSNGLVYFDDDGEATVLDVDLSNVSTALTHTVLGTQVVEVTVTMTVDHAETHRQPMRPDAPDG